MVKKIADRVSAHYLLDEEAAVNSLLDLVSVEHQHTGDITEHATQLVESVRSQPDRLSPLERFLTEYDLATEEGVLLMCLAETLLRVPDKDTVDALIADKIRDADWEKHLGNRDLLVNASTWGLMLTGQLLHDPDPVKGNPLHLWQELVSNLSEPVVRTSIRLAMRVIGDQFVLGETIGEALSRAARKGRPWEDFSFDMLGEAAITSGEARDYLAAYSHAIDTVAQRKTEDRQWGISVKLSALCPRFEVHQWQRAESELTTALKTLALQAREADIPLTVDAEESDRLAPGLAVFANVLHDPAMKDWSGLGLAVQAYQKRAIDVLHHVAALAKAAKKNVPVRLVKGAYWDGEIKQAQLQGLTDFPVFTRKCNTDLSFQAGVLVLKQHSDYLYPQFATHNAYSVAWVKHFFSPRQCEFQRLWGMGETLYGELNRDAEEPYRCRVYAPVGSHNRLLPYLVRRLLENGANTSFVHRIADATVPVSAIVADPVTQAQQNTGGHRHPRIALPLQLFGESRQNSSGINLADTQELDTLLQAIRSHDTLDLKVHPLVKDSTPGDNNFLIYNPADPQVAIGECCHADANTVSIAMNHAVDAWPDWQNSDAQSRAAILEETADLLQENRALLISLCVREAGKTIVDAHNEIREAVDFLRFYAVECRRLLAGPVTLPGPVGESNTLALRGKGVFMCISPWNFPVAIFTGQIAAALAAGNTVLAKPAEQTSACAMTVVRLFHQAGIPESVLAFLPGDGATIGDQVLTDERLAGVVFTGSTKVARTIENRLAQKKGAIATLIAETGGINAMLVDSTALAEQVVKDVVYSAFNSAGQRCSALRVLYLQEEVADRITDLIIGRLQELQIGDPGLLETDIGPVTNTEAQKEIQDHIDLAANDNRLVYQVELPADKAAACFVGPAIIKLEQLGDLQDEIFGPVLHIIRYRAKDLMSVCDDINRSGFALTFGIHSRISQRIETVSQRIQAGNIYINRNMVGAVVGSQPFGGSALSGTGPKAGGPHYLARFCTEKTITNNTAAIGGDPSLFAIDD